jgi:tRNA modification GTPase
VNIYSDDDAIAAIATPIGVGGISVIRVSGKNALDIADRGFRGKVSLALAPSHTVYFGKFVDAHNEIIDEVVATVFRSPNSYTSDDTVEISCHGGIFVTRRILELLLEFGARMAQPGEFTKRAFLNGRIDLTQAEAIADLIHSGSEISRRTSLQQLEGLLSVKINELRETLIRICGLLELELDFTEEGLEFIDKPNIINELGKIRTQLRDLVNSYEIGKIYREGVKVVLTGKPNVGKSSLLNLLLNENRAIVTEMPGTTRDVIEEDITLEGLLFKLVDTAGIRESKDLVEKEGIRRTEYQVEDADIVLFILDPSQGYSTEDNDVLKSLANRKEASRTLVVVENKSDLGIILNNPEVSYLSKNYKYIRLSSRTGEGVDLLRKLLVESSLRGRYSITEKSVVLSNTRHKSAAQKAIDSLDLAEQGLKENRSNDLIAIDLRGALAHLGVITGAITTEDVLNSIFSKFCIGK